MKNPRVKVAVVSQKGKKKRWKKGHSSDSNPEAKKHRIAAKNRFFNRNEGSCVSVQLFEMIFNN